MPSLLALLVDCGTPAAKPEVTALAESTCARCHASAADEWRGSMHQTSFTSADFQRSYRDEPRAYCVGCHAPLEDKTAGIGCTACHSADRRHASTAPDRPHATTKECRSCHDFDVPGTAAMLQATEREHRASPFADRTCESCHMKRGGHRFDVTRNADFLARAIVVDDARVGGGAVVVRVASRGVGHRFPTGDLFRRLRIVVAGYGQEGALTCAETFYLRRDLDEHRARRETPEGDTRLDGTPRELRVACALPPARVHVNVRYERGAAGTGDDLDTFATLDLVDRDVAIDASSDAPLRR
ncbi:MAG: multiheme c-type cytochrome [Labilithrix sp.]